MVNYKIGDFLIQIKNAALSQKREIVVENTKLIYEVAKTLKDENILEDLTQKDGNLIARLKYHKKEPILIDVKLHSKPGLRVYIDKEKLAQRKGISKLVLSTSKGVMSSKKALKVGVGGEVIAEIW